MNTEEEAKDPDAPSDSPPSPTGPASAQGPPSSPSLRPLSESGWGQECPGSPTKKTKRASDPPLSASPLAGPTSAVGHPSSSSLPTSRSEDAPDVPPPASPVACLAHAAVEEDEDPFGSLELDDVEYVPSYTVTSEDKMMKRKAKQDKKRKKDEEVVPVDEPSDPESPPPGVNLSEAWDWPPRLSAPLYNYFTMVFSRKPQAKNLCIDFYELLSWNAELACTIVNAKEKADVERLNALLESALENLHKDNGRGPTNIKYLDKPDCCYPVKKILDSCKLFKTIRLFESVSVQTDVKMLTFHGKRIIRVILAQILSYISAGFTWNGMLCLDDIYWTEVEGIVYIQILRKPTNENVEATQQVLDIKNIWNNIFSSYLEVEKETLPLYICRLKSDLLGVNAITVSSEWFFKYLIYHPAFASSIARRHFIIEAASIIKSCVLPGGSMFKTLFEDRPSRVWHFSALSNPVLEKTFNYRKNLKKQPVDLFPKKVIVEINPGVSVSYSNPAKVTVYELVESEEAAEGERAAGDAADGEKAPGDDLAAEVEKAVGDDVAARDASKVEKVARDTAKDEKDPADGAEDEKAPADGAEDEKAPGDDVAAEGEKATGDDVADIDDLAVGDDDEGDVTAEDDLTVGDDDDEGDVVGGDDDVAGGDDDVGDVAGGDDDVGDVAGGDEGDVAGVVEGDIAAGGEEKKKKEKKKKDDPDYKEARGELVRFVRNSLSHIPDSNIKLLTGDDPEILNASVFDDLMPDLINGVLEAIASKKEKKAVLQRFLGLWSAYEACVDNQKDYCGQ